MSLGWNSKGSLHTNVLVRLVNEVYHGVALGCLAYLRESLAFSNGVIKKFVLLWTVNPGLPGFEILII